ncbi:C45 family autoproteolytic acyltransferase/hydolase [Acrocarpospora phusangensis]|nr:C45 family peptidase [Acrocarpospora phusangensis]
MIRLRGTPSERGQAYGAQARDEIDEAVRVYRRWFASFARMSWDEVRAAALPHQKWLEESSPRHAGEIAGIAAGSERDVTEIVALNFRTEIAYRAVGGAALSECTVLGADATATIGGHVYVAQNWDWLTELLPVTVLLDVEFEGGRFVTVTEPGMLAKFGVNAAGVGLCVNLLGSDTHGLGGSFHTLAREVLESGSAVEAAWAVTGSRRAGSGNYLIGAASGELVDLEFNPVGYELHFPGNGTLAHTNHFLGQDPGVRDRLRFLPGLSPGTYFRQDRAQRLLAAEAEPGVDVAGLQRILRDHYGAPEGICRHDRPAGGGREVLGQTNVSVIIDLTAAELHYTLGCPCERDYERMVLPWA